MQRTYLCLVSALPAILSCVATYTYDFPAYNIESSTASPTVPTTTTTTTTSTTSTTTTTTTTLPDCLTGWQLFQDYNYCFVNTPVYQPDAVTGCADLGATLTSIHSAAEQAFVNTLVNMVAIWLGGTKICAVTTRPPGTNDATCWAWLDGTPWDYLTAATWRPGQPDFFTAQQTCVMMNYGSTAGYFDDVECVPPSFTIAIPYVCKRM